MFVALSMLSRLHPHSLEMIIDPYFKLCQLRSNIFNGLAIPFSKLMNPTSQVEGQPIDLTFNTVANRDVPLIDD